MASPDLSGYLPAEEYRAQAPGKFVALSHGRTHFRLFGAGTCTAAQPLIVCVHGIAAELAVWQHFIAHFVALGRTVLAFDLYGRGYSDATPARNDLALFVGQLHELLEHVDIRAAVRTDTIDLVGLSLGGAISAGFSARYPERVRKLILSAPAGLGLPTLSLRVLKYILGWELAQSVIMGAIRTFSSEKQGLTLLLSSSMAHPDDPDSIAYHQMRSKRVDAVAQHCPGYLSSLVSTLGHFELNSMHDHFAALGRARDGTDFLVVWGDADRVVHFRDAAVLTQLAPNARLHVIKGMGHIDHLVMTRFRDQFHTAAQEYLQA